MATEIVMPRMGYDMTEGKLLRWFKREGDTVAKGEAVAEIETDKVAIEVEAYAAGTLQEIQVHEGDTVAVGTRMALVVAPGEQLPPAQQPAAAQPAPVAASAAPPIAQAADERKTGPARGQSIAALNASPLARRVAQERGVDITTVQGTGPGGRITREDVLAVAERTGAPTPASQPTAAAPAAQPDNVTPPAQPTIAAAPAPGSAPAATHQPAAPSAETSARPAPATGERPLTRLQQTIGRHMVDSKTSAPHFYLTMRVDMTEAMALRQQLNAKLEEAARISVNDLIVKAAAQALTAFPAFNASFAGDRLTLHEEIAVCLAVALEDGLVTPVVHQAGQKTLKQIARETRALVERTRTGKNRQEDYEGGTFTVSNLGMFDVDTFVAIINPPQAAILAVGAVQRLPVYVGDDLVPRMLMTMTLSTDHRVTDGANAARFLAQVRDDLEHPLQLLA